jgi:copper chaperone CopZ
MKKTYKIDVDCANCANEMEDAVKAVNGVKDCTVNFMTLKMKVDYEDGVDPDEMLPLLKKSIEDSGSDGVIVD